ncbi:hypothetical protein M5D96_013582 [Drosophila gunungcola]|uniref:Uncharacterized protein n=1 Tax=Drosophila gunungcola TaxID=103775 RepID=A0A9P9YB21_9MUSC|nr:hypothetical protein M5D96_013582 [Drosophila gunungcola]
MSPDDFIGVRSGWRVWEDDDLGLAEHREGITGVVEGVTMKLNLELELDLDLHIIGNCLVRKDLQCSISISITITITITELFGQPPSQPASEQTNSNSSAQTAIPRSPEIT